MSDRIAGLMAKLRALEQEIERELAPDRESKAAAFRYRIERRAVTFEEATKRRHRELRKAIVAFFRDSNIATVATAPIIYAVVVPIALLDLALSAYQATCFRVYRIPRVVRSKYVVLDRRHLDYLNWIEKLNCEFCSYANGVFAYAREIGSRTEQYWCPIKHARRALGVHSRYREFLEYGDAEAWRRELPVQREAIARTQ